MSVVQNPVCDADLSFGEHLLKFGRDNPGIEKRYLYDLVALIRRRQKDELFARESRELGRKLCSGVQHPLYSDHLDQIDMTGRFGWSLKLMLQGYVMRYRRDLIWHDAGEFFAKVVSAGVSYQIPYTFASRHLLSDQWQIEAEPGVPAQHTLEDMR